MARKKRRSKYLYVAYRYPDGVEERIGRMLLSGHVWAIRFHRVGPTVDKEIEEETEFMDSGDAAVLLFERWWDEQRKLDAHSVLRAGERMKELSDPETRCLVSHALFDAFTDFSTRKSHRALDRGVAPWSWWETTGRDYVPPCGFSCRCALIGVTGRHAQRMIESGEAFDLTAGVPPDAAGAMDICYKRWAEALLGAWNESRRSGLREDEATEHALAAAKASIGFDAKANHTSLSWSE